MRHADQTPFTTHLRQSAQQELPKSANVFDLAEDGLDHPLPFGIRFTALLRTQFAGHSLFGCQVLRYTALWSKGNLLVVFQPLRGNIRVDLFAFQIGNVLLAEVAGVGVESADPLSTPAA